MLGIAAQGPCTVIEGYLRTATTYLSSVKGPGHIDKDAFVARIGEGLEYLHDRKIVNLDLNLDSILVNEVRSINVFVILFFLNWGIQLSHQIIWCKGRTIRYSGGRGRGGGLGFFPPARTFYFFQHQMANFFFQRHIQSNIFFLETYQIKHFIFHHYSHVVTV